MNLPGGELVRICGWDCIVCWRELWGPLLHQRTLLYPEVATFTPVCLLWSLLPWCTHRLFTWPRPPNLGSNRYMVGSGMSMGSDPKRELREALRCLVLIIFLLWVYQLCSVKVFLEKLCLDYSFPWIEWHLIIPDNHRTWAASFYKTQWFRFTFRPASIYREAHCARLSGECQDPGGTTEFLKELRLAGDMR